MTFNRDDFEAITAAGVTVATFETRDLAVAYVQTRKNSHPGMYVERVTVTTHRVKAYRPRPASPSVERISA